MKNKHLVILVLAVLTLVGCKSAELNKNPYSTSASLIGHPAQGVLHLRGVSDEMPDRESAIKDAHKKAIQHMFYMGFPDADILDMKNPMIRKGRGIETEHKAFFDNFWDSGYQQYIIGIDEKYYACNLTAKNCVVTVSNFKINYNILRRDLERSKILNRIGF